MSHNFVAVSDIYRKILLISVSESMESAKVVPKGTIQIKPDTIAELIIFRKIQLILKWLL